MTVRHGFVDESVRSDGWYRLTLVHVAARDLGDVSREVRALLPKGRQRIHFSSENDAQRRRILDGVLLLPFEAVIVAAPYRRGRHDGLARRRCIEFLVDALEPSVALLVFDSRGAQRDHEDRRVIRSALQLRDREDAVSYTHRGSLDELLLALPDAVGWSIGAGGRFTQATRGRVREVFLPESR